MTPDTAFARRLEALRPGITKYVRTLSNDIDTAEEIGGDTIRLAWEHRDRFVDDGKPRCLQNWTFTIARNRYFFWRRGLPQKRRGGYVDDLSVAELPSIPAPQESAIHLQDALDALDRLPREVADAVMQTALGYGSAELGPVLNCEPQTIRTRVHRGRAMLRTDMRL